MYYFITKGKCLEIRFSSSRHQVLEIGHAAGSHLSCWAAAVFLKLSNEILERMALHQIQLKWRLIHRPSIQPEAIGRRFVSRCSCCDPDNLIHRCPIGVSVSFFGSLLR